MIQIGLDIGTSSVKLAALQDGEVRKVWYAAHHGQILKPLLEAAAQLTPLGQEMRLAVTGSNAPVLTE